MAVNLGGTMNILLAAKAHRVARVIHFSSAQVFGIAEGEQRPDYFPVDDDHPRNASRPYGISKRMSEDLCAVFTRETGIPTISLRPVAVWGPDEYTRIEQARRQDPDYEWSPYWEYGAFVHVEDVASATLTTLTCPDPGHIAALLCADDISASAPSREMVERLMAEVEWRGGDEYEQEPYRSLIDCTRAKTVLGWSPARMWSERHRFLPA
jgi:nucleoside-diphosphate-sugar epimerase